MYEGYFNSINKQLEWLKWSKNKHSVNLTKFCLAISTVHGQ